MGISRFASFRVLAIAACAALASGCASTSGGFDKESGYGNPAYHGPGAYGQAKKAYGPATADYGAARVRTDRIAGRGDRTKVDVCAVPFLCGKRR